MHMNEILAVLVCTLCLIAGLWFTVLYYISGANGHAFFAGLSFVGAFISLGYLSIVCSKKNKEESDGEE